MITKKDIVQMVRKITKQKAGGVDHRIMHPERDWFVGLTLAVLFFITGIFYTGYEFLTHLERSDDPTSVSSSVIQYDQKTIAKVLERYGSLKQQFESLRVQRSGSIPAAVEESAETNIELGEEIEGSDTSTGTIELE